MTAAMVGVVALVLTGVRWRTVGVAMLLTLVVANAPWLGVMGAVCAAVVFAVRRLRSRRVDAQRDSIDLAALCDLTAIALTGGLGLQSALELAAVHTGGTVGAEVTGVLRSARVTGVSVAMATADGIGRPLYRTLGRAAATGASSLEPVARLADELSANVAAQRLEAVKKKPVAMLFPLTLLILPGFLLLAVAPTVLEAFGRLDL